MWKEDILVEGKKYTVNEDGTYDCYLVKDKKIGERI
jgi:hypothetical protein